MRGTREELNFKPRTSHLAPARSRTSVRWPARLQSAGTWNRPTRLEFSIAPDAPAVLRTEVRVPRPVHGR